MASITETGMRTTGVEEEMKVTGVEMTGEIFGSTFKSFNVNNICLHLQTRTWRWRRGSSARGGLGR